jgi:hypothetical protein
MATKYRYFDLLAWVRSLRGSQRLRALVVFQDTHCTSRHGQVLAIGRSS